jgi:hypothetical protein
MAAYAPDHPTDMTRFALLAGETRYLKPPESRLPGVLRPGRLRQNGFPLTVQLGMGCLPA